MGVFPEQAAHWDWMAELIRSAGRSTRVLNLFGYTGLATLAAAQAGASVTHVDASKKAIAWARQNQELSGLSDRPVRWLEMMSTSSCGARPGAARYTKAWCSIHQNLAAALKGRSGNFSIPYPTCCNPAGRC